MSGVGRGTDSMKPGCFVISPLGVGLPGLLAVAEGGNKVAHQWNGVAYTTRGARSVRAVKGGALKSIIDDELVDVPLETVYELRLWAVLSDGTDEGTWRARELRWVNGSGARDVRTYSSTDEAGAGAPGESRECWLNRNRYLQHGWSSEDGPRGHMTSIEVFGTEPRYGNTVFMDELMTGKWA